MGLRSGLPLALLALLAGSPSAQPATLAQVKHFVVIYEENHSFDNLYGGWEGVRGLAAADPGALVQTSQQGAPFKCLLQTDVNLGSPPLAATCLDATTPRQF